MKWIASSKGLAKFNDTFWIVYNTTNSGLPYNLTTTIAIENNVKWIGTFSLSGGMAKFNDTNWVIYNTSNSGIPGNVIRDIEIDNWGIKWVGVDFGGGVGRYNSITNSWIIYNTFNSGLPDGYMSCILTQKHIKWFGTQGGGLARFNDTNWVVYDPSNSPLLSYAILGLALDSNRNLWIGTGGGLVIYKENGIVGIIKNHTNLPKNFVLHQNSPNPFNPFTTIKFDVPIASRVRIEIYNICGKLIEVLKNSFMTAGSYSISWNGSNYPSGVYFCQLQSDNFSESKKMILLK